MVLPPIRLVTFDVLYTVIAPRLPIHVQYSQTFAPYLGVLDPNLIRQSFKTAFGALQKEQPVYSKGSQAWWGEVIRRTTLGAGADAKLVDSSLAEIVPRLMNRFSSKEGYRAFEDSIPALHCLREKSNVLTAIVSNADSRIRLVLQDLDFPSFLDPIVLSEEEGAEKPSPEIFLRTLVRVNEREMSEIKPRECLNWSGAWCEIWGHWTIHMISDYQGALAAGMNALLLRRPGTDGEQAHKEAENWLSEVPIVVVRWVNRHNA